MSSHTDIKKWKSKNQKTDIESASDYSINHANEIALTNGFCEVAFLVNNNADKR